MNKLGNTFTIIKLSPTSFKFICLEKDYTLRAWKIAPNPGKHGPIGVRVKRKRPNIIKSTSRTNFLSYMGNSLIFLAKKSWRKLFPTVFTAAEGSMALRTGWGTSTGSTIRNIMGRHIFDGIFYKLFITSGSLQTTIFKFWRTIHRGRVWTLPHCSTRLTSWHSLNWWRNKLFHRWIKFTMMSSWMDKRSPHHFSQCSLLWFRSEMTSLTGFWRF